MQRIMVSFLATLLIVPTLLFAEGKLQWENWSDDLFARAEKEKKLVLLDLEAIWCHWCHVMEKETYSNPEVGKLIAAHFIPVKVDQDARPDLGVRYQEYGWPATIIFNSKGEELSKNAGYIDANEMQALLTKLVKDPKPIESDIALTSAPQTKEGLSPDIKTKLEEKHDKFIDREKGGLKTSHKYLDRDTFDYAIIAASKGDKDQADYVKLSLKENLALIDPVWGGVYQYSTHQDWNHPHFEKIMLSQSANLRIYAQAYQVWSDPAYLKTANDIVRFLDTFLTSPEGAFYTSQDADVVRGVHSEDYFSLNDAARRAKGIPHVDTNIYSRENGWMIRSLVSLYVATGDGTYLNRATKAANWIVKHRTLPEGAGFSHGENTKGAAVLSDNLSMGHAMLALYAATGNRDWLKRSEETANYIRKHFYQQGKSGFVSTDILYKSQFKPTRDLDENIELTRYFNLLSRYTGNNEFKKVALENLAYVGQPVIALRRVCESGILQANIEISEEPLHVTVVGPKVDQQAQQLYVEALKYPALYKKTEWLDRTEGPLPHMDVEYPTLDKAAAFVCTQKRCSTPIFDPGKLKMTVDRVRGVAKKIG